jgi:hypothetical protein
MAPRKSGSSSSAITPRRASPKRSSGSSRNSSGIDFETLMVNQAFGIGLDTSLMSGGMSSNDLIRMQILTGGQADKIIRDRAMTGIAGEMMGLSKSAIKKAQDEVTTREVTHSIASQMFGSPTPTPSFGGMPMGNALFPAPGTVNPVIAAFMFHGNKF